MLALAECDMYLKNRRFRRRLSQWSEPVPSRTQHIHKHSRFYAAAGSCDANSRRCCCCCCTRRGVDGNMNRLFQFRVWLIECGFHYLVPLLCVVTTSHQPPAVRDRRTGGNGDKPDRLLRLFIWLRAINIPAGRWNNAHALRHPARDTVTTISFNFYHHTAVMKRGGACVCVRVHCEKNINLRWWCGAREFVHIRAYTHAHTMAAQ